MDYLQGLNPPQYEAVTSTEGPLMVLAGAGSGKTKVLTMRIAHLIQNQVDPFQILALTFTNKAAKEMKERIAKVVGQSDARSIWMGTFHSVFARILRVEGHLLGFPNHFTIYDTQDALNVIKKVLKDLNIDTELYKPKKVLGRISQYKNNLITVSAYFNSPELIEEDKIANFASIGEIYQKYVETCFRSGAMDFDDLLLRTNELLTRFPDILAKYQDRFRYILVDEYQDTNHSQYLIVKALASRFENICVVGDDAQSIYSFRGANIQNILNFEKDYPDTKKVALEQNYRSTQTIVNAAKNIIDKNKNQLQKEIFSKNEVGDLVSVYRSSSDADEASFVVSNLFDLHHSEQRKYSDFAILYRTNNQTRAFEDALRRRNIPYKVYGGMSFYQRKEVKDYIAYLRLIINPNDQEALYRVINYPIRGIGDTTQNKLLIFADTHQLQMSDVLSQIMHYGPQIGLNAGVSKKLEEFWEMIRSFQIMAKQDNLSALALHVAQSTGIIKVLKDDQSPEGISKLENIQEMINSIQGFYDEQIQLEDGDSSLSFFLENIALASDSQDKTQTENEVSLMTIHLSKGLEFPIVHLVGLEENLFPSFMSATSREDLEEERRLFYVAITRAEKKVFLSYATSRFQWGKITDREPSRFLSEIDEKYIHFINGLQSKSSFSNHSGLKSSLFEESSIRFEKKPDKLTPKTPIVVPKNFVPLSYTQVQNKGNTYEEVALNDQVKHDRFGAGKVIFIDGADPNNVKVKVDFAHSGEKTLLLKFAKLTKI